MVALTEKVESEIGWTPSFDCVVLARRLYRLVSAAQRAAVGRVLDLRGPLASGFAYERASDLVVARIGGSSANSPFDTVCSFGALSEVEELQFGLEYIRAAMGSHSRLLFVELDGEASRWRKLLDGSVRLIWGVSASRDISGTLWRSGFELLYLQRWPVPVLGPVTVKVVYGVARLNPDF